MNDRIRVRRTRHRGPVASICTNIEKNRILCSHGASKSRPFAVACHVITRMLGSAVDVFAQPREARDHGIAAMKMDEPPNAVLEAFQNHDVVLLGASERASKRLIT